jgi:hypothetical protein
LRVNQGAVEALLRHQDEPRKVRLNQPSGPTGRAVDSAGTSEGDLQVGDRGRLRLEEALATGVVVPTPSRHKWNHWALVVDRRLLNRDGKPEIDFKSMRN